MKKRSRSDLLLLLLPLCASCRGVSAQTAVTPHGSSTIGISIVPPVPPNHLPRALFDSLGTVSGPPLSGGPYRRDIVLVSFDPGTPLSARQAAIDSVKGIVVGGEKDRESDDGLYYVRITGGTTAALLAATQVLHRQPHVAQASWWELARRTEQ